MTTTFDFSLVTITEPSPYGKTFSLVDGQLARVTHGQHRRGMLRRVRTDLGGLLAIMRDARPGQHLTAGVPDIAPGSDAPLAAARLAGPGDLTRTADVMPFPRGPGLMVVDVDGQQDLNAVLEQLRDVAEEVDACAMVASTSSSSNIVATATGTAMQGIGGWHLLIPVIDATDIPRALQVLFDRLWLAGHGQVKSSEAGQPLLRTVVDLAMRNPCQPVFMVSHLGAGLAQKRTFQDWDGEMLDTRAALPDLTGQEQQRLQLLQEDAVERMAVALADARADWEERRVKQMVARGVNADQAREQCRQAADAGDLCADWPLTLADGRQVTVADVLADPAAFHGKPCRDPLEPDYGGPSVAKVYSDQPKPVLRSHAHDENGRVYFLKPYTAAALEKAGTLGQRLIASAKAAARQTEAAQAEASRDNSGQHWLDVVKGYQAPLHHWRQPPPIRWAVDELIREGTVGTLIAPGATGKTTLLITLGICHALGWPFLGRRVKQGGFLLLSLDDGQEDLDAATGAVMTAMGVSESDRVVVGNYLRVISLQGRSGPKSFNLPGSPGAPNPEMLRDLLEACMHTPALVGICVDTLRQFAGGPTNAEEVIMQVSSICANIATRTGAYVVIPHHTGKAGARDDQGDMYAGSGSAAIADNARFVLVLETVKDRSDLSRLSAEVQQDQNAGTCIVLRLSSRRGSIRHKTAADLYIARRGYLMELAEAEEMSREARISQILGAIAAEVKAGGKVSKNSLHKTLGCNRNKLFADVDDLIECGLVAGGDFERRSGGTATSLQKTISRDGLTAAGWAFLRDRQGP